MYKIKKIFLDPSNAFVQMWIHGKDCYFRINIYAPNEKKQYCVFETEGDQKEINKIINQLIEDNDLNDL